MTSALSMIWLLVPAACAQAGQPQATDAKAQDVLRMWAEYQGHLPAVTLRLRKSATCGRVEQPDDMGESLYTVAIQRPGLVAIRAANEDAEIELVCDGTQMKVHLPQVHEYAEVPTPPTVASLAARDWGQMFGIVRRYIDAPGLRAVLSDQPIAALSDAPQEARYVGSETVLGQKSHHLRMDVEGAPGDVWISEGDQPHLVRVTTSYEMRNTDGPPLIVRRWTDVAEYTFWTTPETVPPERFAFKQPPKTKAADHIQKAAVTPDEPLSPLPVGATAEVAWTLEGGWMGVLGDGSSVVALTPDGKLSRIDAAGQVTLKADTGVPMGMLSIATLGPDKVRAIVTTFGMSSDIHAVSAAGAALWSHEDDASTDCLATADLDGDGLDEVILGGEGVRALGPDGKELWATETPEWVNSVAAIDWNGDGSNDVVVTGRVFTSGRPQLRAFSRDGKKIGEITSSLDSVQFTAMPAVGGRQALVIVIGWSGESPGFIEAMSPGGQVKWRLHLAGDADEVRPASTRPWVAVGSEGRVWIIDAERGSVIATIPHVPQSLDLAWLEPAEGGPLLVVLGDQHVTAYRVLAE